MAKSALIGMLKKKATSTRHTFSISLTWSASSNRNIRRSYSMNNSWFGGFHCDLSTNCKLVLQWMHFRLRIKCWSNLCFPMFVTLASLRSPRQFQMPRVMSSGRIRTSHRRQYRAVMHFPTLHLTFACQTFTMKKKGGKPIDSCMENRKCRVTSPKNPNEQHITLTYSNYRHKQ